jgi:lactaldehyde dehydrogenase
MIILDDANLDLAVDAIVYGRLARGNGQICCAVKRVYATEGIYDELAGRIVAKTQQLIVGDQLNEATDVGPLIGEKYAVGVEQAIARLVQEGATLATGGARQGTFITPAVLTDVPSDSPTMAEEIFGTVLPLVRVASLDEAITLANDTPYGLQASIFTQDIKRALKAATQINVGSVMINGTTAMRAENLPFGGVGETGGYREGLHDTVLDFTRQKTIVAIGALA